jgi:hypothetical protein
MELFHSTFCHFPTFSGLLQLSILLSLSTLSFANPSSLCPDVSSPIPVVLLHLVFYAAYGKSIAILLPLFVVESSSSSSSSIGTTTLVGFWPAQLSLSILSRKVLQSAVASSTSKPQLGGEPGI